MVVIADPERPWVLPGCRPAAGRARSGGQITEPERRVLPAGGAKPQPDQNIVQHSRISNRGIVFFPNLHQGGVEGNSRLLEIPGSARGPHGDLNCQRTVRSPHGEDRRRHRERKRRGCVEQEQTGCCGVLPLTGFGGFDPEDLKEKSATPFGGVAPSFTGGAEGNRTPDLLNAIQALSQLSYSPPRNAWKLAAPSGSVNLA